MTALSIAEPSVPRHKLTGTRTRGAAAGQLKDLLIAYHDFRVTCEQQHDPLEEALRRWQTARLKATHADLYRTHRYHNGLDFLLQDLYAPQQFTRRDDDIERIFPMMVKLLPETVLQLVARLVELNLLTQRLDQTLASHLRAMNHVGPITPAAYAQAFQASNDSINRRHQLQLIADVGDDLDRYVRSKTLALLLRMTRGAAEMAGLGDLHNFLRRGFDAFLEMEGVTELLDTVVRRETLILEGLLAGNASVLPAASLSS